MTALAQRLSRPAIARRSAVLAAGALIALAVVHLIDGPGSLTDQAYIGTLELSLSAACVVLAVMLVVRPSRDVWLVVAALTWAALGLFVASRTVGLPGSSDDIGNWQPTLGLVNVATELVIIAVASRALARRS
jgi:hypothetical protein